MQTTLYLQSGFLKAVMEPPEKKPLTPKYTKSIYGQWKYKAKDLQALHDLSLAPRIWTLLKFYNLCVQSHDLLIQIPNIFRLMAKFRDIIKLKEESNKVDISSPELFDITAAPIEVTVLSAMLSPRWQISDNQTIWRNRFFSSTVSLQDAHCTHAPWLYIRFSSEECFLLLSQRGQWCHELWALICLPEKVFWGILAFPFWPGTSKSNIFQNIPSCRSCR